MSDVKLETSTMCLEKLNRELRRRDLRAVTPKQYQALEKLDRLKAWGDHECKAVGLSPSTTTVQCWVTKYRDQVSCYFELRAAEVADRLLLAGAGWWAGKVKAERAEYDRLRSHLVWKLADAA